MTVLGSCVVCASMALAKCSDCHVYICDPVCRDAHKLEHRAMSPAPQSRSGAVWKKRKMRKAA